MIQSSGKIVGVGSALVDILLQESDTFLAQTKGAKGGMTLVEYTDIEKILARSTTQPDSVPGGSACNTIVGIGALGAPAVFIGKCGDDGLGALLENDLIKNQVTPKLTKSESPTGRVLSIITPDAQRSMFTFLGASSEATPEELTEEQFDDAAMVHIEGYLLFNKELIERALMLAKNSGALVSLDLASYTVVEASRDYLDILIDKYVDILIANEDEAFAFTGIKDERKALESMASRIDISVVKMGKRGSLISHKGKTSEIGVLGSGDALDSTGAGDLWASGFLYGLYKNLPIEKAGLLGAACGYEVCQVIGAAIPPEGWDRIKKDFLP